MRKSPPPKDSVYAEREQGNNSLTGVVTSLSSNLWEHIFFKILKCISVEEKKMCI